MKTSEEQIKEFRNEQNNKSTKMVRQRVLTMPQSLRVAKLWYKMVAVVGGAVRWTYWTMDELEFQQICGEAMIHELMEYPAPYARNSSNLKILLKCVVSYLSRSHYFRRNLDS